MEIEVSTANGSASELSVRDALVRVRDKYDLHAFEWTDRVDIVEGAVPHSHPVLTLSERYRSTDEELLATYLHEQLHYWSMQCPGAADGRDERVFETLRERYPLPLDPPRGCGDEFSNLIHLHV